MGYRFGFSKKGMLVFVLAMLPNLLFFLSPAMDMALTAPPWLDFLENATRVLCVAAMVGLVPTAKEERDKNWLYLGLAFLLCYYLCWAVGFAGVADLWVMLLLSVLPIIYFICTQVWLKNYVAVLCSLLFGITHIAATCITYL